jgi:peptide subunit release factor RF-3
MTFKSKLERNNLLLMVILSDIENKRQIECASLSGPIVMRKDFRGGHNTYCPSLRLVTLGRNRCMEEGITITDLAEPRLPAMLQQAAAKKALKVIIGMLARMVLDVQVLVFY